ncbi:uncharacterized protein Targ [Calliphora vicina]|uniref:uncharacterized protein Targ n=1 Tax=Calliphora vicina TaxID=7373 RepID=UPI00325B67B0
MGKKFKKDVATDTSEFQVVSSCSSSSSSTSTEITKSSSTLAYTSTSIVTELNKKIKPAAVARNKRVSDTSPPKRPLKKRYSKDDYISPSTSSSLKSLKNVALSRLNQKEATTSIEQIVSDLSYSTVTTSSTITESVEFPLTTTENEESRNTQRKPETVPPTFYYDSVSSTTSTITSIARASTTIPAKEKVATDPDNENKSLSLDSLKKDLVSDTGATKETPDRKPVFVDDSVIIEDSVSGTDLKGSKESLGENKELSLKFVKIDTDSESFKKSSISRHVERATSSEESNEKRQLPALLKSSKSQHVRTASTYGDDDDDSDDEDRESTNLQMGHVFVYMVIPPDGGYGWLITFISFLCQVVVDGIMFSIGIVLPDIAKDFNIPGSNVVLVASMQVGFYFLSGTVSSAFINKFGFRPVALSGCLMSITVLTIASFSVNLPMMIVFYSILGGPSLSMIWVSSQLIIGYYFDKYRPIANGAACSGAGAGIMLFSYMNSVLVPVIGWRNLMRVHVGFLIVVLIMTLTFIEVAPTRIGKVKEPLLAEDTESESFDLLTGLTEYARYSFKVNDKEYSLDDNFETMLEKTDDPKDKKSPKCCYDCLKKCCPSLQRYWEHQREIKAKKEATKRYVIKQDLIERQDLFYMGPKDHKQQQNVEELLKKRASQRHSIADEHGEWRSISLDDFDNKHKRHTVISTLTNLQQLKKDQQTSEELKGKEKHPFLEFFSPQNLIHPKIRKAFSLLFDFRLLAIMEFRILLLSAFLFPMGFNIPFVYSTVRVQIDASFAKLISPTIGFSNFAFRIASGFVAFKFREYTTYICGGGMFFGGIAVLVSAFYGLDVVWFQFLYAMCYGIAPAFYSTLRAIIYVRSLGLDKLTNAFGLTALAMGMGVFIGTTAGGILNDFTGSYTASFVFAGICICTSGALKLVLPYLIKLSKDKERK